MGTSKYWGYISLTSRSGYWYYALSLRFNLWYNLDNFEVRIVFDAIFFEKIGAVHTVNLQLNNSNDEFNN